MKNQDEFFSEEKVLQKREQDEENKTEECDGREDAESKMLKEHLEKNPSMVREMFMGVMKSGPMMPPFFEKIDGKHITQALCTMDKEIDHEHADRKWKRCFTAGYFIVGLVFFIYLAHFFVNTNNVDLLKEMLKIGGSVVIGGLGGYGINESRRRKE